MIGEGAYKKYTKQRPGGFLPGRCYLCEKLNYDKEKMKMANYDNNELFDLGSAPISEDFDPFALEEESTGGTAEETAVPQPKEEVPVQEQAAPVEVEAPAPVEPAPVESPSRPKTCTCSMIWRKCRTPPASGSKTT